MPKKPYNILRLKKTFDLKIPQSSIYKTIICYIIFYPRSIFQKYKIKKSINYLLIICLKCILEGRFLLNVNVKIINASLKFLIKVPIQKAKSYKNLYINQISQTNFKSFLNQRSDTASILSSLNSSLPFFSFCISFFLHEKIFLYLAFCSSHIWLDIQARDVHLKTLRGHSNI